MRPGIGGTELPAKQPKGGCIQVAVSRQVSRVYWYKERPKKGISTNLPQFVIIVK